MNENDQRMKRFAKEHRDTCGSEPHLVAFWAHLRPGGRIPGERDVIEQRCKVCDAVNEIVLNTGELEVIALGEDGTPVYQLVGADDSPF